MYIASQHILNWRKTMNTKLNNKRRLTEKQPSFSRIRRGNKSTQGRRSFVGGEASPAALRKEKANLVIAAIVTGSLWLASLWVIATSLQLPG